MVERDVMVEITNAIIEHWEQNPEVTMQDILELITEVLKQA